MAKKGKVGLSLEILSFLLIVVCALVTLWVTRPQQAKLTLENNQLHYVGQVRNERLDGMGELSYSNGDHYQGHFSKGYFDGYGRYTSAEGWTYEGGFEKGQANGQGKLVLADGKVYQGKFKQGIYQK